MKTDLLDRFKKQKVIVLGDFYLDSYVQTKIAGISPEKPVLRIVEERTEHAPGAAGNLAVNLAALGAEVVAIGVIGSDRAGELLVSKLNEYAIDTSCLIASADRVTGTFTRYLADTGTESHHLIRVDRENDNRIPQDVLQRLNDCISRELESAKGLFIADYDESPNSTGLFGSGIISKAIEQAHDRGVFSVGTSRLNAGRLSRLTYLICNQKEATQIGMTSLNELENFSREIVERLALTGICITLGEDGAFGYTRSHKIRSTVSQNRVAVDTCGAGDTFASAFLLSMLSDGSLDESMTLATHSASIAVTKSGTQPVNALEIETSWRAGCGKVLSADQLPVQLDIIRLNRRMVFTNGYFDLFHSGHVQFLQEARKLGDLLIVGINSDRSTQANKGPGRPLLKEQERIAILTELQCVDYVTVFDELTPINLIKTLKPDVLVKGGNYTENEVVGRDLIKSIGGRIVIIPYKGTVTTNSLMGSIKNASAGLRNE